MHTSTFRAAVVRAPNGPDSIEIVDVAAVDPGPGQVLVRVAGATVNPVDLAVASGFFHTAGMIDQPERPGLGMDFAGTVLAAGPGVDLAVGDRVAGAVIGFDRDFVPTPSNSSCRQPTLLWCPTIWIWSRQQRCRSTHWQQPRSSTCSETHLPAPTDCWLRGRPGRSARTSCRSHVTAAGR